MYILYGVDLVLYFLSVQNVMQSRRHVKRRLDTFFLWFSTALLLLITICISTSAVFGEEMWIVNASYPGGQAAYLAAYSSVWYQTLGTTASVALNLLADALMIYRLYVLWHSWLVIAFPCLLYVGSFCLGITELYLSGVPGGTIFAGISVDVDLAYLCSTIGLNVIVTCFIVGRLLHFSRRTRHILGRDTVKTYTDLSSILIESALPYALSGIAFLISYGIGSQTSALFLDIWIMWTCLSPQMIVLRVTSGRAWTKEKVAQSFGPTSFNPSRSGGDGTMESNNATLIQLRSMTKSNVSSTDLSTKV